MTFCYLAAFNWWMLLCPSTLSHDWQMGSIPLVTSISDIRNLITFATLFALLLLSYRAILDFEVSLCFHVSLLYLYRHYLCIIELVETFYYGNICCILSKEK